MSKCDIKSHGISTTKIHSLTEIYSGLGGLRPIKIFHRVVWDPDTSTQHVTFALALLDDPI